MTKILQCTCGNKISLDPVRDGEVARCRCGKRVNLVPGGFSVTCKCGEQFPVQANQAGSTVPCICGESVRVPSLSALRGSAGLEPIRTTAIEKIQASLEKGELPCGERCATTKKTTKDVLWFRVHCDDTGGEMRGVPPWLWLLCLVAPFLGHAVNAYLLSSALRDRATLSREKDSRFQHQIDIPLAVVNEKQAYVRRMWRSGHATLLNRVPAYRALFAEFPYGTFQLLKESETGAVHPDHLRQSSLEVGIHVKTPR